MHQLGLKINPKKLVEPSTSVVCLGILINTEDRTMSIPPAKLQEIIQSCHEWHTKWLCSKRQPQSLLGSLLYICKCVKPAGVFLNHMLTLLRDDSILFCTFIALNLCKADSKAQHQKSSLRNHLSIAVAKSSTTETPDRVYAKEGIPCGRDMILTFS